MFFDRKAIGTPLFKFNLQDVLFREFKDLGDCSVDPEITAIYPLFDGEKTKLVLGTRG